MRPSIAPWLLVVAGCQASESHGSSNVRAYVAGVAEERTSESRPRVSWSSDLRIEHRPTERWHQHSFCAVTRGIWREEWPLGLLVATDADEHIVGHAWEPDEAAPSGGFLRLLLGYGDAHQGERLRELVQMLGDLGPSYGEARLLPDGRVRLDYVGPLDTRDLLYADERALRIHRAED